jgi:hypothetical protein
MWQNKKNRILIYVWVREKGNEGDLGEGGGGMVDEKKRTDIFKVRETKRGGKKRINCQYYDILWREGETESAIILNFRVV